MKKRKYLWRLVIVGLLGLIFPAVLAFNIFWKYSLSEWTKSNENFYGNTLNTYISLLDKKIQGLEKFAAQISAESREHDSIFRDGGALLSDNTYETYMAIKELEDKYASSDVTEWGIYFYDIDKIITSAYAYTPENFVYKYTGKNLEDSQCADFFSEDNYLMLETLFDSTNTAKKDDGYLLAGTCTKIGQEGSRALVFYVLSPKDVQDSLAIAGAEGISYYLRDKESGDVLLTWGEVPEKKAKDILKLNPWKETRGVKQKVLYEVMSAYPQVAVTAYISGDSLQNNIIDWFSNIKLLMFVTVCILVVTCLSAIYILYKPMYELTNKFGYKGGSEFDTIRNRLDEQGARIGEQHMLILDLLINHLIYGVPIAVEQITRLGIAENMNHYCVFLMEGYSFLNSEVEQLTSQIEAEFETRVFVTDWREENCSVMIAFLKDPDVSVLSEKLEQWLKERYADQCSLYTGKVYDKLENIQLSFRSCIEQMKKKNGKKQKESLNTKTLTPKKEQQKKLLEEIMAYLEVNYRDSNLTQIQVADMFQMSNYTLSRLFKNQAGVGFSEYLAGKRLEYAKELLLTTSYSVKEIAAMAGFTSENYFSRTFKLYEGVSPSNFRSQ